jgi:hypothetical protein
MYKTYKGIVCTCCLRDYLRPVFVSPFVIVCKLGYTVIGDTVYDLKFPDKLKLNFPVWGFNRTYKLLYEMAVHRKPIGSLL